MSDSGRAQQAADAVAGRTFFQRTFAAFHYPEFRLLWMGACLSSVGTWMQTVAQNWLVLDLTNSPRMLGLDAFLGQIPIFLFSLIGGVIADRMDRRRLLVGSQLVQMACAFLLASLFALGLVQVWHILALSFVVGLAQAFGGPAYSALVPTLVPVKELQNAVALNSIQFNLARVIGPMLGGLLLTTVGAAWCFGINGLSYVAPILALTALPMRQTPMKAGSTLFGSLKEGLNFVAAREGLPALIAIAFFMTAFGIPLMVYIPVVVRDVFHGGPDLFTWMLVVSGLGAIIGALLVAAFGAIPDKGRIALLTLALLGVLIAGFGLSKSLVLSSVLLFLGGVALVAVFAMISSLVQLIVPDEMRGRVMSVYNVAFRGGMPFGALISGELITHSNVGTVLALNGVILFLIAMWFLVIQRRVARL
ncbi:MAG: MFS transporter [Bryobacteraceae bacterium]|nr:MFS transporter [Bryobacteraceae bacterium]